MPNINSIIMRILNQDTEHPILIMIMAFTEYYSVFNSERSIKAQNKYSKISNNIMALYWMLNCYSFSDFSLIHYV